MPKIAMVMAHSQTIGIVGKISVRQSIKQSKAGPAGLQGGPLLLCRRGASRAWTLSDKTGLEVHLEASTRKRETSPVNPELLETKY